MIKQIPTAGRIAAMLLFSFSCFGLLLFVWLSFGGSIPLKPEGYRFEVAIPEASTLAQEADVRMAGVTVGKVKHKELAAGASRTLVEIELEKRFAPIPKDAKVVLRQKTLFGETYVELAPGHRAAGALPDGGRLASSRVEPTVELDEIFNAFDRPTRDAFKDWMAQLDRTFGGRSRRRSSEALNDALGNVGGFADEGNAVLGILDEHRDAVHKLIRNTGGVAGALSRREGALRELIVNSHRTFDATASRQEALAQTFQILPTFLDESRATLARLERFSRLAHPVVRDLKRPATELGPTVRDLGDLAPDLEGLFRRLDPLIDASDPGLPALERTVRGAGPLFDSLHPFFSELNPILSYLSFYQLSLGAFFSNGLTNLARGTTPATPWSTQNALYDRRSFRRHATRPAYDRGNAYVAPNVYGRGIGFGTIESFTCPGDKEVPTPTESPESSGEQAAPPCFVQPPSLFQGQQFPRLVKGRAPIVTAPKQREGTHPAKP
jgi:phospholipid/cholesterol/gamma-HCH transport system substrate-binding protein